MLNKVLLAAATALTLGACGSAVRQPTAADFARYDKMRQCDAELAELSRQADGSVRRAHAAEAAYIATRNEGIAKKNADMLAAEVAQNQADFAAYKQRCSSF